MTTPDMAAPPPARTTRFLTEAELAERLGVSIRTLQRYRKDGCGPEWSRIGTRRGLIRYTEHDVAAWIASRRLAEGKS